MLLNKYAPSRPRGSMGRGCPPCNTSGKLTWLPDMLPASPAIHLDRLDNAKLSTVARTTRNHGCIALSANRARTEFFSENSFPARFGRLDCVLCQGPAR